MDLLISQLLTADERPLQLNLQSLALPTVSLLFVLFIDLIHLLEDLWGGTESRESEVVTNSLNQNIRKLSEAACARPMHFTKPHFDILHCLLLATHA